MFNEYLLAPPCYFDAFHSGAAPSLKFEMDSNVLKL